MLLTALKSTAIRNIDWRKPSFRDGEPKDSLKAARSLAENAGAALLLYFGCCPYEKKEVLSDLGAKLAKLLSKQYNKEVCDIGKNRLRIYEKRLRADA